MDDFKVYISLLVIILLVLFGIHHFEDKENTAPVVESKVQEEKPIGKYKVVRFDGCQYVEKTVDYTMSYRGYGYMAHKGNCDNPIHKN